MRKHNKRFAERWGRVGGDRTNFAQRMAHNIANDKGFQLAANFLLRGLLRKVGIA